MKYLKAALFAFNLLIWVSFIVVHWAEDVKLIPPSPTREAYNIRGIP